MKQSLCALFMATNLNYFAEGRGMNNIEDDSESRQLQAETAEVTEENVDESLSEEKTLQGTIKVLVKEVEIDQKITEEEIKERKAERETNMKFFDSFL